MELLSNIFRGRLGLGETYWFYGFIPGLAWLLPLSVIKHRSPQATIVVVTWIVYTTIANIAIWRAADRYEGKRVWAWWAKVHAIVWSLPVIGALLSPLFLAMAPESSQVSITPKPALSGAPAQPQLSDYQRTVLHIQELLSKGAIYEIYAHAQLIAVDRHPTEQLHEHALESTQFWWRDDRTTFIYLKNKTKSPVSTLAVTFSPVACDLFGARETFAVELSRPLKPDEIAVAAITPSLATSATDEHNCLTLTGAR